LKPFLPSFAGIGVPKIRGIFANYFEIILFVKELTSLRMSNIRALERTDAGVWFDDAWLRSSVDIVAWVWEKGR